MRKFSISLGFATFDQGTPPYPETIRNQFTIQSILAHHPLVETILVIDNNPNAQTPLEEFCKKCGPRVRYVAHASPVGTSSPRNRVFAESKSEYTACVDGHVVLYPGFFEALADFYEAHGRNCPDLLHGVMVGEAGGVHATHMNDQWRGEMWGTWGTAWVTKEGKIFSCINSKDNEIVLVSMDDNAQRPLTESELASLMYGRVPGGWAGHENVFRQQGCSHPTKPFVVPGHGMGFFASRTDSWLPFHPDARGFGGEEMTTAVRYRQAFRRCWTVPGARWWHDFGRWYVQQDHGAGVVPYRLTLWDKVRNYVLEFKRLGLDIGIIRNQFPPSRFPEQQWQQLLAGSVWPQSPGEAPMPPDLVASNYGTPTATPEPIIAGESSAPAPMIPADGDGGSGLLFEPATTPPLTPTVDDLFLQACSAGEPESDDIPVLRHLASRCGPHNQPGHVVEVVTFGGSLSSLAFLAAGVPSLTTVCPPDHPKIKNEWLRPNSFYSRMPMTEGFRPDMVEACDLLYLDIYPYTAQAVWDALTKYAEKSRRVVVVRGSTKFAEKIQNNGKVQPLVLPAVRTYLTKNPHWTSVAQHQTGLGLIVLSRDDRDKRQPPPLLRKMLNFGIALATHASNGFTPATRDQRDARVEVCVICPERSHDYCNACGCNVVKKASWNEEKCPKELWPS